VILFKHGNGAFGINVLILFCDIYLLCFLDKLWRNRLLFLVDLTIGLYFLLKVIFVSHITGPWCRKIFNFVVLPFWILHTSSLVLGWVK
jgi:hypothetical protein